MSGFEVLNIFGRLTNINRTKVDFVQADVNNDGQVTQEEFRNIESMCNIDSDKITFGGVDKNGDGVIVESEWKTIQVGMDMQSVLNQIQGAISRELCGVDSVLRQELAEYLAQRTNDWANVVNMNLDNAKDVFKTYIEGEMQNWLNANNSRRPSVIIQTVAAELLNGDPDAGVAGYLDSATQSDYHQRLITEAINSFARGWMECYYANYDNATDLAIALRAAVQAYMSEVTNEQNGTTRLDEIQSQAIAHEKSRADNAVNTINTRIETIRNSQQQWMDRISDAKTYLGSLDCHGNTAAEQGIARIITALDFSYEIFENILSRVVVIDGEIQYQDNMGMDHWLSEAQTAQGNAQGAGTSKDAATYANNAITALEEAERLYSIYNQTIELTNENLNNAHDIEQGIANGTTTGGTTTGGTTNENNNPALAEEIDNVLGNYHVSTSVPNNSTGTVNSETALRNAAKQVIDSYLDQMKNTLSHSNIGVSGAIINTAVTNVKNYYHNILDGDMSSFNSYIIGLDDQYFQNLQMGIQDYHPYVNSSNPGEIALNITGIAHKLRDEIIRLSGTTGSTTNEETDNRTGLERLDDALNGYTSTETYESPAGLTRDAAIINNVKNDAKSKVNTMLENMAASMRAEELTENWITAALATSKSHYSTMLSTIYDSFDRDGINCTYVDFDPDRGGPRGTHLRITINAVGIAEYLKSEYLALDPNNGNGI